MALKLFLSPLSFTSAGLNPSHNSQPLSLSNHYRSGTEVRFSQLNNAYGEKLSQEPDGLVKEVGDGGNPSNALIEKSLVRQFVPRKKLSGEDDHPAFRKMSINMKESAKKNGGNSGRRADIKLGNDGVSYVIEGAPFEFKYSYTEMPKTKPIRLREAPFSPFGPVETPRPWTGRAPLPPSKKQVKEFDSFKLPPPNKKGVKPVQAPGPYLPGSGPRYVKTREEILGDPLTSEEVEDLVRGSLRTRRQLNMGRDGLTHNMLDNIHSHWKRKRVCKIKCKGVCTVDMDNVCQQLEEKTGGKIIYRKGGVLFLFRGRNYNFRTRPLFPLMLWKPVTPVYPRLVKKVPDGLTEQEAAAIRKKGHELTPICKLGKNGVYTDLVKHVQEAFEVCELVKINCQGLNPSDYRKIGAKLRDLIQCVIISFEREQILLWRGRKWRPLLEKPEEETNDFDAKSVTVSSLLKSDPENQTLLSVLEGQPHKESVQMTNEANDSQDSERMNSSFESTDILESVSDNTEFCIEKIQSESVQEIIRLWKEAVVSGSALVMNDGNLDADQVYQSSVSLARTAPPGPVFQHRPKMRTPREEVKEELFPEAEGFLLPLEIGAKEWKDSSKDKRTKPFKNVMRVTQSREVLILDDLAKLLS